MEHTIGNFINGKWILKGEEYLTVFNKYTGKVLAQTPLASRKEVEEAISSSSIAFSNYRRTNSEDRLILFESIIEKMIVKSEYLAQLICQEAGKPISYAKTEIQRCIATLRAASKECLDISGEVIPMNYAVGKGKTAFTKKMPLGPIIAISPYNFPLNLALHKIAPALAAGCSIVIKPSPFTPLSLLAFAKIMEEAGAPKGLINVVITDDELAEVMVRDERFKLLSFTGSPQIGWHLKNIAGKKKVVLELGGNAAIYIDENQDLQKIAQEAAIGAFLYAGQICISTQRIFVHEDGYDHFLRLICQFTDELAVGDPSNEATIVSSLIDNLHLNRIDEWVQEAIEDRPDSLLMGGTKLGNNIYSPTILTNISRHHKVHSEEIFGPVVVIEKVKDFKEGIAEINNSKFGLQAGIYVSEIEKIKWINEELEVGGIIYNNIPGFRIDTMPYGGIKDSGIGREGIKYAMEEMLEEKLIVI